MRRFGKLVCSSPRHRSTIGLRVRKLLKGLGMGRQGLSISLCAVVFLVFLAGCNWWTEETSESENAPPRIDSSVRIDQIDSMQNWQLEPSRSTGDAGESGAEVEEGQLALRLRVGQRFPLAKRISQTLTQSLPGGPQISRSEIDLLIAVSVEEVHAGRTRLGVHYQRVRYAHDIAGERVHYDSSYPSQQPASDAVRAYQGLLNNGFSFWIGADNRIIELVGFDDFLRRCVHGIPPARQHEFLTQLAVTEDGQGIANFVDDSIGLLPYDPKARTGATVRVGQTWARQRQVFHPIPMTIAEQYTISQLTEQDATIDILASITPSTVATYDQRTGQANSQCLVIRSGYSAGHCTIDRNTGLPLISRIERVLDMSVQLTDGSQIPQTKSIVTTIQAFPQQGMSPSNSHRDPHVTPAEATE